MITLAIRGSKNQSIAILLVIQTVFIMPILLIFAVQLIPAVLVKIAPTTNQKNELVVGCWLLVICCLLFASGENVWQRIYNWLFVGNSGGRCFRLPYEGLSKQRIAKIAPTVKSHGLLLVRMISDDTEHTCLVAQSLIVSAGNEQLFAKSLANGLKFWLLGLPAGIGFATLKAIVKLWLGWNSSESGVFSAGNGAAMRSAILGVCYGAVPSKLSSLVAISTRLTHRDPKAEYGSMAVAVAAYLASTEEEVSPDKYYQTLLQFLPSATAEFWQLISQACHSAAREETEVTFAKSLGLTKGISGYVYNTVPIVIQVWLRYQRDYQGAITAIIKLGGDTDSTAAILGGIIGGRVGKAGIPQSWLDGLWSYPRSVNWMEALGKRLARVTENGVAQPALSLPVFARIIHNLIF